jgi:hypothetical protein
LLIASCLFSKSFLAARPGAVLNFGDLWHYWQFWQYATKLLPSYYFTPPYPLPIDPTRSHFGVGLSHPPQAMASQADPAAAYKHFYYLINRLILHPSLLPEGKKERIRTLNNFARRRPFFRSLIFHPPLTVCA